MSLEILKSVSVVGLMTLLSRISGLIRDILLANILGDKAAADVFVVAFRIPNTFRRIFGEGAFSVAFVPVFTDFRVNHTTDDTTRFLQLMIGRFGLLLLLFAAAGVLLAPLLVTLFAAGFLNDPEKYKVAVLATRITFPYIFFIALVAMFAGMLNSCGRFAAPAATPILLNLCLISAALLLVPYMDSAPIALSIGVLAAGAVQLLFQIPFLRREKLTFRPRIMKRAGDKKGLEGARRVYRLVLPAILGVSVNQVNVFVSTILASLLVTGSISWLYYSSRLIEFPVGVFGLALSTSILPYLSRISARDSGQSFSETLDWATRWAFLVCIPATVGLILLAEAMVVTIYYHGDFTLNGVKMTAASLTAYSVGMIAIVMARIHATGFYARQDIRTPVRIAMYSLGINIVLSLILIFPLRHVGLALATSFSSLFNAGMIYFFLRKQTIFVLGTGWVLFLLRLLGASLLMGIFLWWFRGSTEMWLEISILSRVWRLFLLVGTGGIIYFALLWLSGLRKDALILVDKSR